MSEAENPVAEHRPTRRGRRRRAAAARHSRDYRARQKEKGMPTGAEIDAMVGRIMVQLACRPNGLKTNGAQMPRLCEVVAMEFSVAAEAKAALETRIYARVRRMWSTQ